MIHDHDITKYVVKSFCCVCAADFRKNVLITLSAARKFMRESRPKFVSAIDYLIRLAGRHKTQNKSNGIRITGTDVIADTEQTHTDLGILSKVCNQNDLTHLQQSNNIRTRAVVLPQQCRSGRDNAFSKTACRNQRYNKMPISRATNRFTVGTF